ncbi:MAG: GntR family transcriptional regulator [Erysipelotrichales bacterium]
MQKKSAKDLAYDYIRERVISGEYKPKQKIDDVQIAKELGISKMPIREAIQFLVSKNFLVSTPKAGTTVTEINIDDIYNLYEPLALIQGLASRIACLSIKEDNIKDLEEINEKMRIAIEGNNFLEMMNVDKEFHNYIIDLTGNPYIKNFSDDLLMQVQRIEVLIFNSDMSYPKSHLKHAQIIDAFRDRDDELAGRITEDHWLNTIPEINVKSLTRLVHALK